MIGSGDIDAVSVNGKLSTKSARSAAGSRSYNENGGLAMNTRSDILARPRAELKTNPHDSRPNLFGGD